MTPVKRSSTRHGVKATPQSPYAKLPAGARCTLSSSAPVLKVEAMLDDTPPKLTSGYGGWQTQSRPQRLAAVEWQGVDPWRLELALVLDGWSQARSVEHDCATLAALATCLGAFQPPPTVSVKLPALVLPDTQWVVETLDWSDGVLRAPDANGHVVRLRQPVAVTLLQLVAASSLRKLPPAAGRKAAGAATARCPSPGGSRGVGKLAAAHRTTTSAILKASKLRDASKVKQGQTLRLR